MEFLDFLTRPRLRTSFGPFARPPPVEASTLKGISIANDDYLYSCCATLRAVLRKDGGCRMERERGVNKRVDEFTLTRFVITLLLHYWSGLVLWRRSLPAAALSQRHPPSLSHSLLAGDAKEQTEGRGFERKWREEAVRVVFQSGFEPTGEGEGVGPSPPKTQS
ncbi:hypothetical protein LXL04_016035 [Taraxacum kok-saghyz]